MAQPGLINITWKSVTAFLHRKRRNPAKIKKEKAVNLPTGPLTEDAPLYNDGFSNHMRLLHDPFFS